MMAIGYVVSKYPAISHTFIQREVLALRNLGAKVETFSIRATDASELLSEDDVNEAKRTWSVLPVPLSTVVLTHLAEFLRHPVAWFATLRFALTHRPFSLRNLRKSLCYFAESILLAAECRRQKVSRLHSHFINSGGEVALIASRHLKLPWSCTLHGLSDYGNPDSNQLSKKLNAADAVVCVSDYGKSQAMLSGQTDDWAKLHVVRCGLNAEMFEDTRVPVNTSGPLNLLTVGRLAPEKAHAGLLQAIAEADRQGANVKLKLIGDGPLRAALEQQVIDLQLSDSVQFMGVQPPSVVRDELSRCDLCVMSSLMEGLPVALMEAMAQRRAVIAPRVAGIPELVHPNENGWLFTPSRWDELTDCIIDAAVHQRHRLPAFGGAGRERVLALHSIERSAEAMASIFGVNLVADSSMPSAQKTGEREPVHC